MTRRAGGVWIGLLLALLLPTLPQAAPSDVPPEILDVRLDDDNHAVITWRKFGSQTSNNVKWTTDGTLGATDRDGSYGTPLADCQSGLRPNPSGDSQWLYGRSCKGDDVADAATRHVTRKDFQVGVYYFQVTVAGKSIHETGTPVSAAFHYSGIFKLTVDPAKDRPTDEETEETEEAGTIGRAVVIGEMNVQAPFERAKPAGADLTIHNQDAINTGASPAKLVFGDGSVLALDRKSTVSFHRAYDSGPGEVLSVSRGRVWYSLTGKPRVFFKRVWAGKQGAGVLLGPRAATFTIQTLGERSARVRVYKGTVTVAGKNLVGGKRVRVGQGLETLLMKGRTPSAPAKLTPETPFWK